MEGENSTANIKNRKRNKLRSVFKVRQEKSSYYYYIGLLIIAIFGCVASGAPKQGFYGIIFISIGMLIAIFPPPFMTMKWLNIGVFLILIFSSTSLLPRSFASNQNWRTHLEYLGLETGNLISPHPVATIESIIILAIVLIVGLCSLGHRLSRKKSLNIASLFTIAVASYSAISMIFFHNELNWVWNPNNQFGFFANSNHMSTLMAMGSLMGISTVLLYIKKKNWMAFLIMLTATGTIWWAILGFSISRAGLIVFICSLIIWVIFAGKKHLNYKLVTSFVVLFSLAIILFLFSDNKLENRLESLFLEKEVKSELISNDKKSVNTSILGLRKYIHSDTYRMIQSEPWTGTGLGSYEFIFPQYKRDIFIYDEAVSNSNVLHPESNWLDLTSQAGISTTLLTLICILGLLFLILIQNRKSRSWLLTLSCVISVLCILAHGIIDVPGQKIGIAISSILLIGIVHNPKYSKNRNSSRCLTWIYQSLAIGIFSLGLILVHSQWFNFRSIIFSDTQLSINKIQNLYELSNSAAKERNFISQKKYLTSAINLTDKSIKRAPLHSDLHFIRGKIYSLLEGNEDLVKYSFKIESALDPSWINLPLRQSEVWLFIDVKETRRLWAEALKRASKFEHNYSKSTWNEILAMATQHPIHIRNVYEIILVKDDPYYIKQWMSFARKDIIDVQMPKILKSNFLSDSTKNDLSIYWEKKSPKIYKAYLESLK